MEKEFIELIGEQLGISDSNLESITEEATLDSLGADSLDQVEILMSLEERYKIKIPDDEAEKFKNVGDVWNYVQKNRKYD